MVANLMDHPQWQSPEKKGKRRVNPEMVRGGGRGTVRAPKWLVFGGADPVLAGALGLIERSVCPRHGRFEILAGTALIGAPSR